MTLEVRCFDSLEAAQSLRHEVNAINSAAPRPDPFSTFEFYENYFRNDEYFPGGRGARLWFLAAFDQDRLVGYLPLKLVTRRSLGLPVRTLGFLVTHDTDRPHVVAAAQQIAHVGAAFFAHLLQRRSEWDFLELQQQDGDSALFPPPESVNMRGYLVRQWPSLEQCSIHLTWSSLPEYFGSMSRNFRVNLRRQMRNLLAAGDVQMVASADPQITPALLDLYLGIEPHSWKAQADACIGRNPRRIDYFRGLLDPRQPLKIRIRLLLMDGMPIAGMIGGTFQQTFYALQMVYDDRFGQLGPGSAVLLMGLRQAFEARYSCFNMLSGFGYYKTRWLAAATETRIAQIYRVGGILYWRRLVGDWKRRLMPERDSGEPGQFNRSRRQAVHHDATSGDGAVRQVVHSAARVDCAAMVERIRGGQGEFLSGKALAAAMPFDCRIAAPADSSAMPVTLTSSPHSAPSRAPRSPNRTMPQ